MNCSRFKFIKFNHLKIFLKICQCLGFIHFTYNSVTGKFEHSTILFCISRFLFAVSLIISGLWIMLLTTLAVARYLNFTDQLLGESEDYLKVLRFCHCFWIFISTFYFTRFYLKRGRVIVPILNEILAIVHKLGVIKDIGIYSGFQYLLFIKLCLSISRLTFHFFPIWVIMVRMGDISTPIGTVLMDITYWSSLYAHLGVLCFYLRMNESLIEFSGPTEHVLRLISISFRIHRLKYVLNKFYAILNVSCYLGLFSDIINTYAMIMNILQLTRYSEFSWSLCMDTLFLLMTSFSTSYDVYLIGLASEMIKAAERLFKRKILMLFCKDNDCKSSTVIDLLLLQEHIQDLSMRAFNVFVLNRNFFFIYFTDIIVGYLIVCMQGFASGQGYTGEESNSS